MNLAKPAGADPALPEGVTRVLEGETKLILGVQVRITDFVEAFVAGKNGITSSYPDFTVELRAGSEAKGERHCRYGTVIEFHGVRFRVQDCATGTRDFKSFADLKAERIAPVS